MAWVSRAWVSLGCANRSRGGISDLACAAGAGIRMGLAMPRSKDQVDRFASRAHAARGWARQAEIPPGSGRRVFFTSASDFTTSANLPWLRRAYGVIPPRYYRRLSPAMHAHDLRPIDEATLELTLLSSDLRRAGAGSLYRQPATLFAVGRAMEWPGIHLPVVRVTHGNALPSQRPCAPPVPLNGGRLMLQEIRARRVHQTIRIFP